MERDILWNRNMQAYSPIYSVVQVPTVEVSMQDVKGDWFLVEYVNSHDGKPVGAHTPYLCPEVHSTDPLC